VNGGSARAFLPVESCLAKAQANPATTLKKVEEIHHTGTEGDDHDHQEHATK
jgi:hypothetical protein